MVVYNMSCYVVVCTAVVLVVVVVRVVVYVVVYVICDVVVRTGLQELGRAGRTGSATNCEVWQ